MHHFVLVHGACHGAWCWYKLSALLKSQGGHRVTALDLGASGIDPRPLDQIGGLSEYLLPLMRFLSSLHENEKVVLVGHSYGGLSIAMAMERFPEKILVGVFVTAYMPNHESPSAALVREYFKRLPEGFTMDCEFTFEQGPGDQSSSLVMFGPEFLKNKVYGTRTSEDLELAATLVRPSELFVRDLSDASLLTKDNYGSVRKVFILCEDDEVMPEDFQMWMTCAYPPEDVISLPGACHMSMLSKPRQLCAHLLDIANKFAM